MEEFDSDVVVVGAGLAGLAAARACVEAGLSTRVVEAGDRVGGRVRNAFGGRPVDLGAEWVAPAVHSTVIAELARYGLEVEATVDPDLACWAFDGLVADDQALFDNRENADFSSVCAAIERDAARIDLDDPQWYRAVDDLDVPMHDYLDRFALATRVREYVLVNSFTLTGADERRYSALALLREVASFGSCAEAFFGTTVRIRGGSAGLASAIVADFERGVIEWSTPVLAVRSVAGDGGVEIAAADRVWRARAAVVAVPVNVMRSLDLDVGLGSSACQVIDAGHVGAVAKIWTHAVGLPARYRSIGWPDVPESYGVPGGDEQLVAAFQLVRSADSTEAAHQAIDELRRRHPGAAIGGEVVMHDWVADPLSKGTWCAAAVGQQPGLYELAAHHGPCFFAGGDVSRRWVGWMDGALTSGADAGRRAVSFVRDGLRQPVRG